MHNAYKSNSREGNHSYSRDIEYELINKTIRLSHFLFFIHLLMENYMFIYFNISSYQTKIDEHNYENVSLCSLQGQCYAFFTIL